MVFQEGRALRLADGAGERRLPPVRGDDLPLPEVDARVDEVLGFVGLGEYRDRMPSELSGGQRRRVAIARAVAARPRIVLYDEPTTGLDPITALTIDEEIIKLRDLERVSSIIVTHQLRDAFYVATPRGAARGMARSRSPRRARRSWSRRGS
jgi:phospholipid/cholesterol/gamma-HCH transport system ATP-binding protein